MILFEALPPENPRSRVITLENPAADRISAVRSSGDGVYIHLMVDELVLHPGALPPENPRSKVITLENPAADRTRAVSSSDNGANIYHWQMFLFRLKNACRIPTHIASREARRRAAVTPEPTFLSPSTLRAKGAQSTGPGA